MTIEEIKKSFSKNLKKYLYMAGKTQSDLVRDLNFRQATVSDWINGKKYPRMDKIEILANYFNISVSDLVSDDSTGQGYYHDPETVRLAQEIHDNPQYRVLFDATRNLKPESIKEVMRFIDYQKAKERGELND